MASVDEDDRDRAVEVSEYFATREAAEEARRNRGSHVRLVPEPDGQWALKYYLPLEALGDD